MNRQLKNAFFLYRNAYRYRYYFGEPLAPQNLIELKVTDRGGSERSVSIIVFTAEGE